MKALDPSKQAWTFGQIVSVFALAGSLISIVGILEEVSPYTATFQRTFCNIKLSKTDPSEENLVPHQLPSSEQCSGLPLYSIRIRSSASEGLERPHSGLPSLAVLEQQLPTFMRLAFTSALTFSPVCKTSPLFRIRFAIRAPLYRWQSTAFIRWCFAPSLLKQS